MLATDVIEPAQANWESPVRFVPKKNCALRLFVDYQKLGSVKIWDSYPVLDLD